jgi:hypothetical protein
MRDLEIWSGEPSPEALVELSHWTLSRRAPYLGKLRALVDRIDPAVRAAALHACRGATGVEGVRAIVHALADADAHVRNAALAALRVTARDAPDRYAHAVFHPSTEIRRASLLDMPPASTGLAIYLRADPATADLTVDATWPRHPLPLAFDLHAATKLTAIELLEVVFRVEPAELAAFVGKELRRGALDRHLEAVASAPALMPAVGRDVLDQLSAALAHVFAHGTPSQIQLGERALEQRVVAILPKKPSVLTRRIVVSLLDRLATRMEPQLLEAVLAFEPSLIEARSIRALGERVVADAAIAGLFRYRWPVRLTHTELDRLLELPIVRDDLALAIAVLGLGGSRLKRLAKLFGEAALVERLVANDRGWDELCKLPQETPALELKWLALVEKASVARYVALAGRALGVLRDRRLGTFVDQLPRRHRAEAFLAFVRRPDVDEARAAPAIHAIAHRLDRAAVTTVLATLLSSGLRKLARALARELPDKLLAAAAANLEDEPVFQLVEICDGPDALPRDREVALAQAVAGRAHPALRAWAAKMLEVAPAAELVAVRAPVAAAIDDAQRQHIATCSDTELAAALAPALGTPVTGVVGALGGRVEGPSVAACAALLGCADPVEYVARELERFSEPTAKFGDRLDVAVAAHWNHVADLPPLAHARLYRWEAHCLALAAWIEGIGGTLAAVMSANALPGLLAAKTLWSGIAECVVFWRYRDHARLEREGSVDLARYCASRIDRPIGRHAARIVVALVEARLAGLSAVRDILLDRTADADAETREQLARLVRLDGMPEPPPRLDASMPTAELIERIRSTRDLPELERWCGDARPAVVQEAVLALLVHGELGQMRLAQMLKRLDEVLQPIPILASIALWDSNAALFAARELAARGALAPQWRFHLCLGLGDRDGALAAVKHPGSWFRPKDWDALVALVDPVRCALELADATHHHAYQRAIALLLEQPASMAVRDAMMRFLAVDADRPLHLRRTIARSLLCDHQVELGLPLVIEEIAETPSTDGDPMMAITLTPRTAELVARAIVDAALIGGHLACTEKRMWYVLDTLKGQLSAPTLGELYTRILEQASTAGARRQASHLVTDDVLRAERLTRVAEVFAWGIRRGIELTGRLFRIHLTSKERDLGHTFLDGNRIFVSPLPLLREEPYGQDVVEGLLLHEIGHHAYHRGEVPQALWKQAHAEGIGHLLNLIADEHLERNLRGVDGAYGDRLKRLDAYAFQHGAHEIAVEVLLECLRGSTAAALIGTPLEVAFDDKSVRLRRGAVLMELERTGHPLARFARALRMGLGNRTGDPLVAQGLELCGSGLKKLDMAGLYDLTVKIAALFGGAISIARVFGGPEGLEFGEREDDVFGGFDDDILQREVERILDPRRNKTGSPGPRDHLCINVNPGEDFDRITHVERVTGDPKQHRETSQLVMRHAHRLRAFLDELGLRWQPQRGRIQGRALDRTRLRNLVTRGDPRILIARQPVRRTDLFLGTIIDCSGSMSAGDNIRRAQRFAVLIAEAVQPLAAVEARFFGFTDSVIYDAGNASDCAVTGLQAGGGNNDAAALLHVANIATQSQKRAKVLVMISDGLPTECSVAALRGLVTTLTKRRGLVCAQVAVRRLEEECFPHYILLDDAQPDIAVARFGRMIADLARRGLAH